MDRRQLIALFAYAVAQSHIALAYGSTQDAVCQDHPQWVAKVLEVMSTIKPGMTRERLLTVFREEGGISTGLHRTYVSRECAYFKVDVDFSAVGRPERDSNGRVTLVEEGDDLIAAVSRPYLEFSIMD